VTGIFKVNMNGKEIETKREGQTIVDGCGEER
jgi:hypothetical protein